jgi:hypothetical protein
MAVDSNVVQSTADFYLWKIYYLAIVTMIPITEAISKSILTPHRDWITYFIWTAPNHPLVKLCISKWKMFR